MTDEELQEFLAESIHTALRKVVQAEGAGDLWNAISANLAAYNEAIETTIIWMHDYGITVRRKRTHGKSRVAL